MRPGSRSAARDGVLLVEQGGRGGISDYTAELARALAGRGLRVDLATATDHLYPALDGVGVHPVFRYERHGTRLGRRPTVRRVVNGVRFLLAVPRLVRLAARARIAHVQGWEHDGLGVVATVALRAAGTPVVLTPHNTFVRDRAHRPRATQAVHGLATRLIVHAWADLENLTADERRRAAVIPHGEYGALARTGGPVDPATARSRLGFDDGAPVALLFGQLRRDKGIEDLLLAARRVPALRVLLVGEDLGGLEGCEALLSEPGLAERVTLRRGYLSMEEAAPYFAAADAVVLPYPRASQSGVLLLAYGFARPVVAYPVGGLAEAVRDGETGWLCAEPTATALADALGAMAAAGPAERRRRGLAGARLAEREYGWAPIAERTSALYDEIARVPSASPAPTPERVAR